MTILDFQTEREPLATANLKRRSWLQALCLRLLVLWMLFVPYASLTAENRCNKDTKKNIKRLTL